MAFGMLKKALCEDPVLAPKNFSVPFELQTDACDTGLGAVLMQKGRPIAYYNKALCARNKMLSTYEKELIAF